MCVTLDAMCTAFLLLVQQNASRRALHPCTPHCMCVPCTPHCMCVPCTPHCMCVTCTPHCMCVPCTPHCMCVPCTPHCMCVPCTPHCMCVPCTPHCVCVPCTRQCALRHDALPPCKGHFAMRRHLQVLTPTETLQDAPSVVEAN